METRIVRNEKKVPVTFVPVDICVDVAHVQSVLEGLTQYNLCLFIDSYSICKICLIAWTFYAINQNFAIIFDGFCWKSKINTAR